MIVASPDRNSLYITHPRAGKITILDARALVAPKLVDISGSPIGIAVSPDGRLFVTDQDRNLLVVLDGKTGAKLAEIKVGQAPAAVVVSPHSKRAFVANSEDDSLSVVDTDRLIVIATVGTGRAPSALALSDQGDRLYVANAESGELAVLSAESLAPLGSAKVGMLPHGVAVVSGGDRVLVANRQSGSVSVVDAASLVVTYRRAARWQQSLCGRRGIGRHRGAERRDRAGAEALAAGRRPARARHRSAGLTKRGARRHCDSKTTDLA